MSVSFGRRRSKESSELASVTASTNETSALNSLRTVQFRLGLKGYNVDDVDAFLERAASDAERLQQRLRDAGLPTD